jgi:hypothetical protein
MMTLDEVKELVRLHGENMSLSFGEGELRQFVDLLSKSSDYGDCLTFNCSLHLDRTFRTWDPEAMFNLFVHDITVDSDNPYYTVNDGMLLSKDKTHLYLVFKDDSSEIHVPSFVNAIEPYAFSSLQKTETCVLPESLEHIAHDQFTRSSIANVTLPESVLTIDEAAFCCCSIKSITIPSKAKCGMFSLEPPEIIKGNSAVGSFLGSQLETIEVSKDNPYYVSKGGCIYSKDGKMLIKVPQLMKGDEKGVFIIPEGVEVIGGHSFNGCARIEKVHAPATLKEIRPLAFYRSTVKQFDVPFGIPCDVSYYLNDDDTEPQKGPACAYYIP